jgi:hypothetical protein
MINSKKETPRRRITVTRSLNEISTKQLGKGFLLCPATPLYTAEPVFVNLLRSPVPEIIDLVFAKTSPKRSFSMTEYERFGLVFTKTRVYKFGHRKRRKLQIKKSKFY